MKFNTVLFVNATIGFSENLFLVNNGNSIIELCNIRDGLLNICSLSHVEIYTLSDYFI